MFDVIMIKKIKYYLLDDLRQIYDSNQKVYIILIAIIVFLSVLSISWIFLSRYEMPKYGTWTGIRPLEDKLALLEKFSSAGEVDALVLGSSIADFGFSAELFSQLMSKKLGREYRAFNYSTGAAEPRTFLTLYKFARLVSKPKSVFIVAPSEPKLREEDPNGGPDLALYNAPVGGSMNYQWTLQANYDLWKLPIMRSIPGIRDLLLFGEYRNLPTNLGMDLYEVNAYGDRVNYAMIQETKSMFDYNKQQEMTILPISLAKVKKCNKLDNATEYYFSNRDIEAMYELKNMIKRDGGKLYIIPASPASTMWESVKLSDTFKLARHNFFKAFPARESAVLCNDVVTDKINIPSYAIADPTHLNTYGARIFTQAVFTALSGDYIVAEKKYVQSPPEGIYSPENKTFNTFSALLQRPANLAHSKLRFRIVKSSSVPALPEKGLFLALRTPENTDIIVPAIPLSSNEFIANVNIPAKKHAEMLVFRLLVDTGLEKTALNSPLAGYEWIVSTTSKIQPSSHLR